MGVNARHWPKRSPRSRRALARAECHIFSDAVDGGIPVTYVSHCDTFGGFPAGATSDGGNINADPLFVNAPGDLRLTVSSPCAGAGADADIAQAGVTIPTTDANGRVRPDPPAIGAYEPVGPAVTLYALDYQNNLFLLTDDPNQYASLTGSGWTGGPTGRVYANATDAPGIVPLYRLLESGTGDHFYTTDPNQRASLIASGAWKDRGVSCYVYPSQASGTVPLYKALNTQTSQHLFTGIAAQYNALPSPPWSLRGPAAYILP